MALARPRRCPLTSPLLLLGRVYIPLAPSTSSRYSTYIVATSRSSCFLSFLVAATISRLADHPLGDLGDSSPSHTTNASSLLPALIATTTAIFFLRQPYPHCFAVA
ncbi:hypothetical protein B296_00030828 [Ensete ventricosum]|uniref:Uncharacterized protein n=1 Tax=Ensete ventricosum TaxID=4639 RepID=A0A427A7J9_ENSVE|nr:hypothetical protein B296_00030828 [Ensete ventricosum]